MLVQWQRQMMEMTTMNIKAMDNRVIGNYKSFFADQIKEAVGEQQKVNRSSMRQLFRSGGLSLAYVEKIQKETGMVILKFPRRMAPRLKVLKSITIISKGAFSALGNHPVEWDCTWGYFCENASFHSAGSDPAPLPQGECRYCRQHALYRHMLSSEFHIPALSWSSCRWYR